MEIEIRRTAEGDWPSLKSIRLRSLAEDPHAFGSAFKDEAARPDGFWRDWAGGTAGSRSLAMLLAYADGTLAGIGGGKGDGEEAEVIAMWVDPTFRGLGIGQRLLAGIEGVFAAQSYSLWVNAGNQAAIALYSRSGFRDTGIRQRLARDPDILEMKMGKGKG
jgi:ribosomal protein S18 acetylase RimI-like enzyme